MKLLLRLDEKLLGVVGSDLVPLVGSAVQDDLDRLTSHEQCLQALAGHGVLRRAVLAVDQADAIDPPFLFVLDEAADAGVVGAEPIVLGRRSGQGRVRRKNHRQHDHPASRHRPGPRIYKTSSWGQHKSLHR